MFSQMFDKLSTFANHHQAIIAAIVTFSIICISWGIEKIMEHHIFYKNPLRGYLIAVIGGLTMLWIVQHYILHVV
jgi:hypothetical protein